MSNRYEVGGVLEDSRVIRLNEPLPYKEGPVKVVIEPLQPKGAQLLDQNRVALEALDRLLAEPEDLPSEKWMELEKIIEEHPLRIRKGSPSWNAVSPRHERCDGNVKVAGTGVGLSK